MLKVGEIVRVGCGEKRVRKIKTGVIEGIYKYHIVVKFPKYRESYSYVSILDSLNNKPVENLMILVNINGRWQRVTEDMI